MVSMKLYSNTRIIGVYMTDITGLFDSFYEHTIMVTKNTAVGHIGPRLVGIIVRG